MRRSETVRGILGEVRNGTGEPRRVLGRVKGPSGRSGTGRGMLGEVREVSGNPRKCPGRDG